MMDKANSMLGVFMMSSAMPYVIHSAVTTISYCGHYHHIGQLEASSACDSSISEYSLSKH